MRKTLFYQKQDCSSSSLLAGYGQSNTMMLMTIQLKVRLLAYTLMLSSPSCSGIDTGRQSTVVMSEY